MNPNTPSEASAPSVQDEAAWQHMDCVRRFLEDTARTNSKDRDDWAEDVAIAINMLVRPASALPAAQQPRPALSGETDEQRAEVCAAWNDLPAELAKHPALQRLYLALGGIVQAAQPAAQQPAVEPPAAWLVHGGRVWADAAYLLEKHAQQAVERRKDGSQATPLYASPTAQPAASQQPKNLGVSPSGQRSPSQAPPIADAAGEVQHAEERVQRALTLAEEYAVDYAVAARTEVVSDINAANRKWRELEAAIRGCKPTPKPLDDAHLQEVFGWAIEGAIASGYQNTNPAPAGHWLAYWWQKGRTAALREGSEPKATTEGLGAEPAEPGHAVARPEESAAQPVAPDVVADARRYQALKPFLRIEDVGDEDFVFGLTVDSEALEEEAQRAKCWRGAVGATVDAAVDALATIDAELPAEGQKP